MDGSSIRKRKLLLKKDTLKVLSDEEINAIGGGSTSEPTRNCGACPTDSSACTPTNNTSLVCQALKTTTLRC